MGTDVVEGNKITEVSPPVPSVFKSSLKLLLQNMFLFSKGWNHLFTQGLGYSPYSKRKPIPASISGYGKM